VDKHSNFRSAHGLIALFSAVMLTACGGGDDPPAGSRAPVPAPATDTAFASPMNTTDTTEAGKVETYNFAEKSNEQTPGTLTFGNGSVTYGATLTGAQAWAGAAVRYYAPNNTGSAPVTAFNASSFTKLKIQLKSTTDALLEVKLQPSPVTADGCTTTASAVVSSTLTELVIDLNAANFPLPGHCATGSAIAAVKAGLYAVDVINVGVSAGAHDLTVGTVKLSQ
jgi:hypothetical protein